VRASESRTSLPALAEVMPQRGAMILLDDVIAHDSIEGTRCLIDLGKQTWLKGRDSTIPAWVALEYMAQCIAAHEGHRAWRDGRKLELGLFVGARRVHFYRPRFAGSGALEVSARYLRGRPALGALSYACEIRGELDRGEGGEVWVEGTLNVALLEGKREARPGSQA